ncbi:MAG: ATP-binding cassette domain-containing protein, partial [Clostridiales bacterium]|nr:ATP-binding cassette domain-containing protein [Clostridiales bacterium]
MTVLDVQDLGVSFGAEVLFEHISFQVGDRDKVALVGVNGAGKTTLFRILTGSFSGYTGACYRSREARLGYMEQHTCAAGTRSVYGELIDVFAPLLEMEAELERISAALLEDTPEREALIARQEFLTQRFHREGGLTFRSRARAALIGLGFGVPEFERPTGELSGGQRSKLALAKLLLSGANFLLLDEPTNHLDIKAVEWLEGFLQEFPGAVLVISHDRYFLDRIANRTVELQHGKLTAYTGNYSEFLQKKEMLQQAIADKYEQDLKEIARLEGIVAQQRQWNREKNIRTAESKLKQIARIREDLVPPDRALERIHLDFTPRRTSGNDVLTVRCLSKSFGERTVFSGLDFHIRRGEKIFLLGPNGCGKTTLLRLCNGEDQADGGQIAWGAAVQIGYFDQVQSGLNLEKQALHEVWDSFPGRTETEIRGALAAFLFKGDDVYKLLGDMSG